MENYSGRNRHSWTQSPAVRPVSTGPHLFLCSLAPRALSLALGNSPWPEQGRFSPGSGGSARLLLRQGSSLPPGGALISSVESLWVPPVPLPRWLPGGEGLSEDGGGSLQAEGDPLKG